MVDKRNVWTVPLDGGGWDNHFEGSTRIMDRGSRKTDVQKQGRERARKHMVEDIIQKADGTIGERNSYGGECRAGRGSAVGPTATSRAAAFRASATRVVVGRRGRRQSRPSQACRQRQRASRAPSPVVASCDRSCASGPSPKV
jgi:riboflavin biosynthesis pyrimidine reductase